MEEPLNPTIHDEKLRKEAPQLVAVLKEMKEGLDIVTSKVRDLTSQVKAKKFPTGDGITYLEVKHLLLLNYCQSLVYYLLRKAKGLSIEGHPLVRSLVEIRIFLEKIRPIDKKFEYQFRKLARGATTNDLQQHNTNEKEVDAPMSKDLLELRPNPEMLIPKMDVADEDARGVYRPPRIAPTSMVEERKGKEDRNARRKDMETLRHARNNEFMRSIINNMEDRPEEVRDTIGTESIELTKFRQKNEERARQEEELFTRAPISKIEKKKAKHLLKSRNGLLGLTESFYDEIKSMPLGDDGVEEQTSAGGGMKKSHSKRKRR